MKRRLIELGLMAACASGPVAATAPQQQSFDEFRRAIASGTPVRIVVDLKQCRSKAGQPGLDVGGAFTPDGFQLRGVSSLAFSSNHFSVHPDGTPTYEFSSYTVEQDRSVAIKTTFLGVPSFQKNAIFELACQLGKGVSFFAIGSPR